MGQVIAQRQASARPKRQRADDVKRTQASQPTVVAKHPVAGDGQSPPQPSNIITYRFVVSLNNLWLVYFCPAATLVETPR